MASAREIDAMRQAITLSARGLGSTSPNPPVGCVILGQDGETAGIGYHRRKGEAHAETQALALAGERARGGTVVVTLEPCNHDGLTPACRRELLKAGVGRVVVGVNDPTSRGEGGAAALKAAGVDVEAGVLDAEVRLVLGPWLTATLRGWPYVTVASSGGVVDDLRCTVDVLVGVDCRLGEGVPGSHGVGMLQLPPNPLSARDPSSDLGSLFRGGARSLLVVDDSPISRSLYAEGLVDRVVADVPGDDPSVIPRLPRGFELVAVTLVRGQLRVSASRTD